MAKGGLSDTSWANLSAEEQLLQAEMFSKRAEFPLLAKIVSGLALTFFDNGATTQKPQILIDAIARFYAEEYGTVHRGVYALSQHATEAFEQVRTKLCRFFGTTEESEWILTTGTTAGLNLLASSWGKTWIQAGDTVVVTRMDHHANFVPWQAMALERKARFEIVELNPDFGLDLEAYRKILESRPKVVAFPAVSNVLGTKNPVRMLAEMAKQAGALVVVDGAQAVGHGPVALAEYGPIDAFVFSAHKLFGPTGAGALWVRGSVLQKMQPVTFGGNMISRVGDQQTSWNEIPARFEPGTPNFVGIIGMGVVLDYLSGIGMARIEAWEQVLTRVLAQALQAIPGVRIFGPASLTDRVSVFSFELAGVHPHDLATFLDTRGIAVRAGHHCAQPLMKTLGVAATTRASLSFYNTLEEIRYFAQTLVEAQAFFGVGAAGAVGKARQR